MRADRTPIKTAEIAPDRLSEQAPALSLSAGEVATLAAAVDASRAKNTLANYRSAWNAWQAWADEHGAHTLPAHPAHVAAYLTHRAANGAKMPTVRMAASAIAAAHTESGLDNPCRSPLVKSAVRGMARQAAQAGKAGQKQAAALTRDALAAIRATACKPRVGPTGRTEWAARAVRRGLVDIALCTVMSDAGLRRSEAAALLWADVDKAEDGSGRLTIRHSKTDKEGEGAVVAITARAMADLEAMREGAGDQDPVFGLSVKAAARAAGLGEGFSGHSGRVGMARRMTSNGAPLTVVMRQGRWESEHMPARYVRNESAGAALAYLC